MGQVLVIFAHPAFQRSRVNRALIRAAGTTEGVTVHDLYETYPDFLIDVRDEQKLIEKHDAVVFQHPFFWYSSPALIKEWLDLVLEYRWAYGEGGDALRGKIMAQAIAEKGRTISRSASCWLPTSRPRGSAAWGMRKPSPCTGRTISTTGRWPGSPATIPPGSPPCAKAARRCGFPHPIDPPWHSKVFSPKRSCISPPHWWRCWWGSGWAWGRCSAI
jgi:hypothetical protein